MYEYTDDNTGEVIRCPKHFMRVIAHLQFGAKNTRYAEELLRLLGIVPLNKDDLDKNLRHLRKALQILRLQGVLIADVRSSKNGGYFVATPDDVEEVERYCDTEERLAKSMLGKVALFRKRFKDMCDKNNGWGDPQQKLF
jgi:hypothetical protein